MRRLIQTILIVLNLALFAASKILHELPRADEYLVIFVIPILFVALPHYFRVRNILIFFAVNVIFLLYSSHDGILDGSDVTVLSILFIVSALASYLVLLLKKSYEKYYGKHVKAEEKKYNFIVSDLEKVEHRGRIVERELVRISRLYEVTKNLSSVLKFRDFLDALFEFLENNFKFDATHLMVFTEGKFTKGISRSIKEQDNAAGCEINYKELVDFMKAEGGTPFYFERSEKEDFFKKIGIQADTFFAFPLYVKKDISAIIAIEGASKLGYNRFDIVVPQIILELKKVELYEQLEKLSIFDGLTNTYLRRHLMERLKEEVDRATRLGLKFSICMVDVDHFKRCNDKYGHLVGDAILKEIAKRLIISVREVDMVSRYGGEEFCIVFPETSENMAFNVVERLRERIDKTCIKAFDEEISMSISAGVATYPENGDTVESLIEAADMALYKAKRKGRNRVISA